MILSNMALFQPIQVGDMRLSHRVVMSPVTLFACNGRGEHYELGAKYYGQRASTKGTMIITEGTYIAERAIGWYNVPGIWTVGQIAGWKRVRHRSCRLKPIFACLRETNNICRSSIQYTKGAPILCFRSWPPDED
jgi:hypothetical protein